MPRARILRASASDFIPKPYPQPDVSMDAVVLGINNFQVVHERYGKQQCIKLLHFIADEILNKILFEERLCRDFAAAVREEQFKVFVQPKFDVTGDEPKVAGAEALVRWFHPELNLISPGLFIPLFESNGLIYELDDYIWHRAASRIREWKDKYGRAIPVSVNISRVEMHDPNLSNRLLKIVEENGIDISDLHLEITESAYVNDSNMIIERVEDLRKKGFFIEMDDFGSGYSSLNMIGELPIDALKLDMQFLRNAFNKKNTKIIDIVLDIARGRSYRTFESKAGYRLHFLS